LTVEARSPSEIKSSRSDVRRKESTSELDAKVLELLKAGNPAIRISEILGRQKSTIYRVQERLLKTGQITSLLENGKRKTPRRAIELRAKILELSRAKTDPVQIANIVGKSKQVVYAHLKNLIVEGNTGITYNQAGPIEKRRWYKIIERTLEELPFYERQGLVPTARKMGYRLVELGVMSKKDLDRYYRVSAEARRGIDSTYSKPSTLPKLPIDCFRDDLRTTIGETDMSVPYEPTPATAPQDWERYLGDEIESVKLSYRHIKNAPYYYDNYHSQCTSGTKGINPGKLYKQPIYCEIWCESETIQPDLLKFQGDIHVQVSAMRGQFSTPSMFKFCKRLKERTEQYAWIEKIVILYFGDSDKAGNDIRKKVEAALNWYRGESEDLLIPVEVELRHIMITQEQVKKYKLTGYQLEAFMTTEKRLKIFKQIVQDAIKDCWDEDIYFENCSDEEYDYEANGEEEPEDVDIDDYPEDPQEGEEDLTIREIMEKRIAEAFKPGWEDE
jgi:transposase